VWSHTNGTFCEIVTEAETVRDTSNLYTTGEVTLLFAVPKPSTLLLTLIALGVAGGWHMRQTVRECLFYRVLGGDSVRIHT
jgi:hypothetical protein